MKDKDIFHFTFLMFHFPLVLLRACGLENGEWQMANGESQMANGDWQIANGKWQMANRKWQMANEKCLHPSASSAQPRRSPRLGGENRAQNRDALYRLSNSQLFKRRDAEDAEVAQRVDGCSLDWLRLRHVISP